MQLSDLDTYAQWVEEIKYDTIEGCWVLKMYPGIIAKGNFTFIAEKLAEHVHAEVVKLICEAVKTDYDSLFTKNRNTDITTTRWASVLVLQRRFNSTLRLISDSVGYTTHVAMYNGIKRATESPHAKAKIQKVYRSYPWLYRRSEAIK